MEPECGAVHPDLPGVHCVSRVGHGHHYGDGPDGDMVTWENESFVPRDHGTTKKRASVTTQSVLRTMKTVLARKEDPWSSHVAAARIEPKLATRERQVLDYLRAHPAEWISGNDLSTVEVGGSQGLRRLRALRDKGWPIERRPDPDSETAWQYRLTAV